jgi:hypothetical protein
VRLLLLFIMIVCFTIQPSQAMFQYQDLQENAGLHPSIAMHTEVPKDILRLSGGSGIYQSISLKEEEEERPLISPRQGRSSKVCMALASCASLLIPFGVAAIVVYFEST